MKPGGYIQKHLAVKTKKYMMLRMFGIVVFAIALTACSKEDDLGIKPVLPEGEAGNRLTAFLDSNEYRIASAMFDEYDLKDTCLMINSMDEFRAIAPPGVALPEIDFEKYTLVIGRYMTMHGGHYLASQYIVSGQEQVTINLIIASRKGGEDYHQVIERHLLWGVYPKIKSVVINTNVVYK
jgi:hypothetical protein